MPTPVPPDVPQVLSISRLPASHTLILKKLVRQHLGLAAGAPAFLRSGPEVLLSARPGGTALPTGKRGDLELPPAVVERLGLAPDHLVGLIERGGAVALKHVDAIEEPGERARLVDREIADRLTRVAVTNPMPEDLVPELTERFRQARLRHPVSPWLDSCQSLEGWRARQRLQRPAADDASLAERLVTERRAAQHDDGSWQGQVSVTARNLRELAQLGLSRDDSSMSRAVAWLLARPQSPHNPGMYFTTDALAARQIEIADGRKAGVRGRFREIKRGEQRLVMAGDDLIRMPCGPRLMWPTALALEALVAAGCEGEERVQGALAFMTAHDWCECGYQHGLADWRRSAPMSDEELSAFEAECQTQYRCGGLTGLDRLLAADDPKGPAGPVRLSRCSTGGGEEYPLRMDLHIQGCEFVTTRAMSQVRHPAMRRFAAAHLWRFAGRQHADDGLFGPEKYGTGFDQAGILETFARYDHPVTPVVVLRSLPWIVENQNADGAWGPPESSAAATLAVLTALDSVAAVLPAGMRV